MSLREAAKKLPVSEATLLRRVKEGAEAADGYFGKGNWRRRPLLRRPIYQVRAEWVAKQVAAEDPPTDSAES
jgi:hypothetical protein